MARLKYWVWLSCISGVRPMIKYRLAQAMGGPEKLFFAQRDELVAAEPLLQKGEADRLMDKSLETASKALSFCEEHGISVLTVQDAAYPDRLRHIPDPPAVLYVWGKLPPVDERLLVAVVGTRKATPYGIQMASAIGRDLAKGGAVVVSGLAVGCDGAAMEAALREGGTVIGVLGTAIDEVYPARNRPLFEATRAHGALVSEYPPHMRTYPVDFKVRNRIVTGLSMGVAVVEAPRKSGTRSTADHALEQGRDVFAVPGNADSYTSGGCNDLIAQGAAPIAGGRDILRAYEGRTDLLRQKAAEPADIHIKKEIDKPKDIVYIDQSATRPKPIPSGLPEPQKKVLTAMTRPDMLADEIIESAGLGAPEVLAALTMLQIAGHVVQGAGKRYTRKL